MTILMMKSVILLSMLILHSNIIVINPLVCESDLSDTATGAKYVLLILTLKKLNLLRLTDLITLVQLR